MTRGKNCGERVKLKESDSRRNNSKQSDACRANFTRFIQTERHVQDGQTFGRKEKTRGWCSLRKHESQFEIRQSWSCSWVRWQYSGRDLCLLNDSRHWHAWQKKFENHWTIAIVCWSVRFSGRFPWFISYSNNWAWELLLSLEFDRGKVETLHSLII